MQNNSFYIKKGSIYMETIQTYLENMFRTLPATAEVFRAKDELYHDLSES